MAKATRGKRGKVGDSKRAVAYLRVSTDEQALGPEAQRAALERWAAAHGVEIVAWHADLGVSGGAALDKRAGLLSAVADLAVRDAGLLLVAKRDRLARDVVVAAMTEQLVERAGARIVSAAGEGSDGDDPAALLMRRMVDAFAEYERAMIGARTRAALAVKRARGERVGKCPYGYRAEEGRLVADEREQAVVARVRALRAEGRTLRAIVAELDANGVRSRGGKPLGLRQVHALAA